MASHEPIQRDALPIVAASDFEASTHDGLPSDDHVEERKSSGAARAQAQGGTQLLFPGMRRLRPNAVINTRNKSHSVNAKLDVPESGAQGVIVSQGGKMGGWSLYVHEGKLRYHYNFVGLLHSQVTSMSTLPPGTYQVRMEFEYEGGGIGQGSTVSLYVDGRKVGEGRIKRTHALFFSMDETLEVGRDLGEPVSPDYGPRGNEFTGTVHWVRIDIEKKARLKRRAPQPRTEGATWGPSAPAPAFIETTWKPEDSVDVM